MPRTRIALLTSTGAWHTDEDAEVLVEALASEGIEAEPAIWDSLGVDWAQYSAAILRSPWDYSDRPEQFLATLERIQLATEVLNPIEVLRWNIDKHYLADLAQAGLPVVPTTFISARNSLQDNDFPTDGCFVVKPTIGAGSRNTARYTQAQRVAATAHVERLLDAGQEVIVQPYIDSVDQLGETGMVFFSGEFSHGFRKSALLRQGQANVDGLFAVEEIAPREPSQAERELAEQVLRITADRFNSSTVLYARVDVLKDPQGQPLLLELEMTEPSYFLSTDPSSPARAAAAYAAALNHAS